MAGRPKIYSEEVLINKATKVFWTKGYHASSAQDLMKAMGIGQGSFYRAFPDGKKELYQKSLTLFLKNSIKNFYAGLGESENPIDFIKTFFKSMLNRSEQQCANGCYLGNAIVEQSNLDYETLKHSSELLDKLKEGFEKALISGQKQGYLKKEQSPKLLAIHLINFWNGINITQRTNVSEEELKQLIELNLKPLH